MKELIDIRKAILPLIFIFIARSLSGQSLATAIEVISSDQSSCDASSDPYRIQSRIISKFVRGDTLSLEIGFAGICCIEYVPGIELSQDTLYIDYHVSKDQHGCTCLCCYSFKHQIKGLRSSNLSVMLWGQPIELSGEKYKTFPVSFEILRGDTINLRDKYGLKQGIWMTGEESHAVYEDDRIQKWGHFRPNGKPKDEYNRKSKVYTEYYRSGSKKRECVKQDDGSMTNCLQWKKNSKKR